MAIYFKIDSLILCGIILLFVLLITNKKAEHRQVTTKIFLGLLVSNILMILLEITTQVLEGTANAQLKQVYSIVLIAYFLIIPFATYLSFYYFDYQIIQNVRKILKRLKIFWAVVLVNTILVLTNQFHHFAYSINEKGVYQRGIWIYLLTALSAFSFIIIFTDMYFYKNKVDSRTKKFIVLFCVPIIVGGILQIVFQGITTMWLGTTLSLLFINSSLQNNLVTIDYLTGVYNRRELDEYVNYKLSKSDDGTISGIFVDIDRFKSINDNFGHLEGDNAIRAVSNIINSALRKGDFLSRYGGDEFVIIPNINDPEKLERLIQSIRKSVESFNLSSTKKYHISLSMGYDIYAGKNKDDFFALLDKHMYEEKRRKHSR